MNSSKRYVPATTPYRVKRYRQKIFRMETLTRRIFARVEEEPDTVSDIRRLMEYYLPTAVKLLEAYKDLDAQPVQGEISSPQSERLGDFRHVEQGF